MRILVVDVAAEHGGAVTVLNQFITEFKNDYENEYIIVLSKLDYEDSCNIKYVYYRWVKKSHIHRLFFDSVTIRRLIKKYNPDKVLSLQNKAFNCRGIYQEVFFHNALPIATKRFSIIESKSLWMYQNIIGLLVRMSLRNAQKIYVQARWIKRQLNYKWKVPEEKIAVKYPIYNTFFQQDSCVDYSKFNTIYLFYPSNSALYKNHEILLNAYKKALEEDGAIKKTILVLTLQKNNLNQKCISIIEDKELPILFLKRLSMDEMKEWYSKSILIFPSYLETIGLPLAEAKSMGCRILAADCEYAHDTLGNYERVIFFNPFSADSVKDAIINCMNTIEK